MKLIISNLRCHLMIFFKQCWLYAKKSAFIYVAATADGAAIGFTSAADDLKETITPLEATLQSKTLPGKNVSSIKKETDKFNPNERRVKIDDPGNSPFYLKAIKQSRKLTNQNNSRFFLVQDEETKILDLTLEHREDKNYLSGTSGKVKKGFINSESEPKFAVKIFKSDKRNNTEIEQCIALRSIYCAQLLGRTGYAFRCNGKQYFITDWHSGINLADANIDAIVEISIEKRIKMALDLIQQVNILHQHGLIHCDIKPKNVILTNDSLKLIDLDGVKLKGGSSLIINIYTSTFLDPQLNYDVAYKSNSYNNFDEQSDIYALGLTLAFLFPDLLAPAYQQKTINVINGNQDTFTFNSIQLHYGKCYKEHQELMDIILQLCSEDKSKRANSTLAVFNQLNKLYEEKYHQSYILGSSLTSKSHFTSSISGDKNRDKLWSNAIIKKETVPQLSPQI